MNGTIGHAVFFFPQALEALGEAIKPYLITGSGDPHLLCRDLDTGGALAKIVLEGQSADGKPMELELLLPLSMIRLVISARGDGLVGFAPRPGKGEPAAH